MFMDTEDMNDIVRIDQNRLYELYPVLIQKMGFSHAMEIVNGTTLYSKPVEEVDALELGLHIIYQANLFIYRQMQNIQDAYPTENDIERIVREKLILAAFERQNNAFQTCNYPLQPREQIESVVDDFMRHRNTIHNREAYRWAIHETCGSSREYNAPSACNQNVGMSR